MASCASLVHRASGSGRGRPVLISILACSLGFHAITSECGTFTKIACVKIKPVSAKPTGFSFVARGGRKRGNRRTDKVL